MKFVALPIQITLGLFQAERFRSARNDHVDKLEPTSKWDTYGEKQINI